MKISEILEISQGSLLTPYANPDIEILGGFAGDLMSDVLASIQPESVLITGLSNPQVIRTALIADVRVVIFARGKQPAQETIKLAIEEKLPVISSDLGLYEISGRLLQHGLPSFEKRMLHAFDSD
ncbi:MAG TPA: DRTGG domain-containing protein [Anaerolineaceae bacterium]|nr:DRTGG domain-containing protein [Anaerolineaceae bacterium]HPS32187.1 DRTGG domain-containing protein [Anaerolineaceae bacterium]